MCGVRGRGAAPFTDQWLVMRAQGRAGPRLRLALRRRPSRFRGGLLTPFRPLKSNSLWSIALQSCPRALRGTVCPCICLEIRCAWARWGREFLERILERFLIAWMRHCPGADCKPQPNSPIACAVMGVSNRLDATAGEIVCVLHPCKQARRRQILPLVVVISAGSVSPMAQRTCTCQARERVRPAPLAAARTPQPWCGHDWAGTDL